MHPDVDTPAPETSRSPPAGPEGLAAPDPGAPSTPARRLSSAELLGSAREIEISHGDALYRLRLTSLGKLILTK